MAPARDFRSHPCYGDPQAASQRAVRCGFFWGVFGWLGFLDFMVLCVLLYFFVCFAVDVLQLFVELFLVVSGEAVVL